MASRNCQGDLSPPYTPPTSGWYAAPPPAYSANPAGYGGWVPPTHVFPDMPPANSVYMTDAPPPYPGINGNNGYSNGAVGSGGAGGWTAPQANGSAQMTSAERKAAEASAPPSADGILRPKQPRSSVCSTPCLLQRPSP